jgi:acyl-CoA reductase-like NAD-dependent aldehyde dehydrogenase
LIEATRSGETGAAEARHAANRAAAAFPTWSRTTPAERRDVLNRAADLLIERRNDLAAAIRRETGGTADWAAFNSRLGAETIREAAALTSQAGGEVVPSGTTGTLAFAVRQPCGVVLSIAPWNAPVVLAARAIATPLCCGNTVLFKASELCPRTHALVAGAFADAGLPDGVLGLIETEAARAEEVVEAIIAHPAVRRVKFTGATRSGRRIAEIAARHLKRCLLELGGKAPLIVLDDADLDEAAAAATFGAFFHQGQICMSTERVIVLDAVAEPFVELLRARAERLAAPGTLGPMVNAQAAARVKGLIDDALGKGARLIAGGRQDGAFLAATVLDGLAPNMRIYHEEVFGPVAAVIRAADVDEAVSVANDTEYGLAAAVFGRDVGRALEVARRLETGICHVNGATIHDEPQMPFGGVKSSGYGRFGGRAGIEEFTELRWITLRSGKQDYPI